MRVPCCLLLCAGLLWAPMTHADGPASQYGLAGPSSNQPAVLQDDHDRVPPDGACYDEDNQVYDCTDDADFAVYGHLDDGYDELAYRDFLSVLSPYGSWIQTTTWGWVWVPSRAVVGYEFQPYYTGGCWILTDYGWTWMSDWDWGWAPFHYGRWVTWAPYGWVWVPGRIWGPAWVHWRYGDGYVGWTPLPPRGVRIAPPVGSRVARWIFVPAPQLGTRAMVRVAPQLVGSLYGRTRAGNVLRFIGTSRVNIGPLPTTLSLAVAPMSLRGLIQALPRAHIAVRPGLPLAARSYLSAVYRSPGMRDVPGPGAAFPPSRVQGLPVFHRPAPALQAPFTSQRPP
ncbi:MAG: hypothetical protein RMK29_13595 [Myxococcales bacterium]|nr:hypothetical protein [Myxococcota bacterium]MDW8282742.1 hypothetical protein [Myxococcales bacterium]